METSKIGFGRKKTTSDYNNFTLGKNKIDVIKNIPYHVQKAQEKKSFNYPNKYSSEEVDKLEPYDFSKEKSEIEKLEEIEKDDIELEFTPSSEEATGKSYSFNETISKMASEISKETFATYDDSLQRFIKYWQVNFIPTVAEFYAANLIQAYFQVGQANTPVLEFSPYANGVINKLEIIKMKKVNELKEFFHRYMWVSCFGEARHSKRLAHKRFKGVGIKTPEWIGSGKGREDCWQDAWKMYNDYVDDIIIKKGMELYLVFNHMNWRSGYGGNKWGFIIETLIKNMCGEIDDVTFVDMSISLVHNGNLFVDKIIHNEVGKLKPLLNLKFRSRIEDVDEILHYINGVTTYPYRDAANWISKNSYIIKKDDSINKNWYV
jgi:hypothetical protein